VDLLVLAHLDYNLVSSHPSSLGRRLTDAMMTGMVKDLMVAYLVRQQEMIGHSWQMRSKEGKWLTAVEAEHCLRNLVPLDMIEVVVVPKVDHPLFSPVNVFGHRNCRLGMHLYSWTQ
jgi:hypothetical protein